MEKHVQLDEHLSGSSVLFVFLCVGISVREWIFAWICKLGCDFAFLGGVSWVMRMYNRWYVRLKCLVWRRCFYSPCWESIWLGFWRGKFSEGKTWEWDQAFSSPLFLFPFLSPSCLLIEEYVWWRGKLGCHTEEVRLGWWVGRQTGKPCKSHLATWLLSQRNLERRDVERYLHFKKKNAAWRMDLREMVGRLLWKPRRDNGEEGTSLWDEINRT